MKLTHVLAFVTALLFSVTAAYARPTPTPTATPTPGASCIPSAPITEYYLDSNGDPQSQVLSTVTRPVVTLATFADYDNAEPPCLTREMENGQYNCPSWESTNMTIESANPIGPIDDADVNNTIQEFSQWNSAPYPTFIIPSVNPYAFQYTNQISPQWVQLSQTMDGTCYKTVLSNAGHGIGDLVDQPGGNPQYFLNPQLCEPNNVGCQRAGRTDLDHWVVIVMDSTGVQGLPDVSAEVSLDPRGDCAQIGGAFSGPYDSISSSGNSTCPGTE